jgi:hypothetical protein
MRKKPCPRCLLTAAAVAGVAWYLLKGKRR